MFYPVWGHVITDNIRRLWFLTSDIFKKEFKNCPLVYIPWREGYLTLERQQNAKRLLEILGVDIDKTQPIMQPTRFNKIILFDDAFFYNAYFTTEYCEMIDRVRNFALKNRMPTSNKKIYYFYGRNQVGEERLAEYFRSKGYEIVSPEKLTLDEQLNLLINADSFASTLGSCAHNSIFLRDGTEAIFIPRHSNPRSNYQDQLNQVHPINAKYVDSTLSVFNFRHDSFCYIISRQLKEFFGDKWDGYSEEDFKIFLDYIKSPIRRGRKPGSLKSKSYSEIFPDFMEQLKRHESLITACEMPPAWETFRPLLSYQTHIGDKGWSLWESEAQINGFPNERRDIQAIKVNHPEHKVYYAVYYGETEGWSEEISAPDKAGTTGKRKSIFGVRIRPDEAGSKEFDILYRVHKFDGEWTPWAKNGEALYSYGVKLNAIQIKLEPKT